MTPCPSHFNLASYVLRSGHAPDRGAALVVTNGTDRRAYSRREIWNRTAAIQQLLLTLQLAPGSRVAIRLPSDADFALSHLAITACGLVAVPLSPMLTDDEVQFIVEDSDAAALLHDGTHSIPKLSGCSLIDVSKAPAERDAALVFADTSADNPAYLVYTSGTTGTPKGVLHAHRSVWARRSMRAGWTDMKPSDIVLHAGALNWTYTMGIAIYDAWSIGATSVIYVGPKSKSVWASLIEAESATLFAAVPSVFRQMLSYSDDVKNKLISLRHGLTAGEALSPTLLAQFQAETGKPLYEALGMSECSTYISNPPGTPAVPGSPGRVQDGRRVAVLPVDSGSTEPLPPGASGMLAVHQSDPGLMLRYWKRPKANAESRRGEWFIGGDIARIDEDGYVFFEGRANDVMNAFGYRVSPDEVEAVIEAHARIHEVGVAEAQVRDDVSVVCAYLVAKDSSLSDAELQKSVAAHCEASLADYKRPKEYRFVRQLPRTRSGKIQRGILEQRWISEQADVSADQ